jgi:adenylate cyclase
MEQFFEELKRRNVFRIGIAYLVAAWLAIQVVETLFPLFGLSDATARAVVIILAIGFIPALILAWLFELTPEGLKRDRDADPTALGIVRMAKRFDRMILVLLVVALVYFAVDKFVLDPARDIAREQEVTEQVRTEVLVESYGEKSIAVLPFTNISDDPDQEYFAEGITEDIITNLSKFGLFFVISRNSTFSYKGSAVNVNDVARELGVQYVLEGSVQRSGDRVRITSQLIDAIGDKHIWAERYDRKIEDIFELQDEISQSIVAAVAPEYLSAEMKRSQRKETRNLDAWDSFMRGYWHFMRFTKDDIATAQDLVQEAIELDPNQANYHGLLAVTHALEVFYGWSGSREESLREALKSAERGLALDDQDAQVIRSAGLVHFFMKNHDIALAYYQRAVQANPYDAESRALLGAALGVAGDYDAALHQFDTAMRLSPRDLHVATWYQYMGIAAFVVGQHEKAAEWSIKATQSNPQLPGGHRTLASSYGILGRLKDAAVAREKLQDLQPHLTIAQLRESLPYFKNPEDLERYLEGLRRAGLPE